MLNNISYGTIKMKKNNIIYNKKIGILNREKEKLRSISNMQQRPKKIFSSILEFNGGKFHLKHINNNKDNKKTVFPLTSRNSTTGDKFMLIEPKNKERKESTKGQNKFKEAYQKKLLSSSKNKKKVNNKYDFSESNSINNTLNNNDLKDKNKTTVKKGTTISTLKTKEKFIKEMKSTKYMEKLKGIQHKKPNYTYSNYNTEEVSSNDNMNSNILNDPNYLTSNTFNTINGANINKINSKKYPKNITLKEKIFKEKDKNNDKAFDCIYNNQEIILDKLENLEKVMLNKGNYNNEFLNSFNKHKQNSMGLNSNSMNIQQSESSKSNFQKIQS
jgi:hypothetical protein